MFQTFNFLYSFFNPTAVHVPDFQFFLIWAVDIFQCFCRAVTIQAVVHFGLKLAPAWNDTFFWFLSSFIYFGICSNSVEQSRCWCQVVFWADDFRAYHPSPLQLSLTPKVIKTNLQSTSNKSYPFGNTVTDYGINWLMGSNLSWLTST
jgi:hypothetical protein